MKCISSCGYSHKPDNLTLLVRHIEDCMANGYCKALTEDPQVIWQDGEFTVVPHLSASINGVNPTVFEINLIKKVPVKLTATNTKTAGEAASGRIEGISASMSVAEKSRPQAQQAPTGKTIRANLD